MKPPPFDVADIIRAHGNPFVEKNRSWLTSLPVPDTDGVGCARSTQGWVELLRCEAGSE
jgi:hypothetical protein